jgi:hypothetical protein
VAALSSAQIGDLSNHYTDLAGATRAILNNTTIQLTRGQAAALSADLTTLSTIGANLATTAAQVAFDHADDAFNKISSATKDANAEASRLSSQAAHITAVVDVLGAVVTLGGSFGSGNPLTVLKAVSALETAVQKSKST